MALNKARTPSNAKNAAITPVSDRGRSGQRSCNTFKACRCCIVANARATSPVAIMRMPIARGPRSVARSPCFSRRYSKTFAMVKSKRDERYSGSHPPHQGAFMGEIGAFVGEARGSIQRGLFGRRFFLHGRPFLSARRGTGARSRRYASRIAPTFDSPR